MIEQIVLIGGQKLKMLGDVEICEIEPGDVIWIRPNGNGPYKIVVEGIERTYNYSRIRYQRDHWHLVCFGFSDVYVAS